MKPGRKGAYRQIVWPLAIAQTLVWAGIFYSFPALLLHWERELGWYREEVTGAFSLALIIAAVAAPWAGRVIDRGLARQLLGFSSLAAAGLLVALSQVDRLWQFYAVWALIGVTMAGALYEACFSFVTRVLGDDARRAITLITLVAGFAGTVSFPTANLVADMAGWRMAAIVFAGLIAFVAAPLNFHATANGDRIAVAHEDTAGAASGEVQAVLARPGFWCLAAAFALSALIHGGVISHLLAILDERKASADAAVLAAALIGPMQVAGRLAMMAAERHVRMAAIAMMSSAGLGIAALALYSAHHAAGLIAMFVVVHGASNGLVSIARPVLTAELLGRRNFGVISGFMALAYMGSIAIAPISASMVWRLAGYDGVLVSAMAMSAASVGLIALAVRLTSRRLP